MEHIAIIGLGYVGLPLAIRMSKKHGNLMGMDVSEKRVAQLNAGHDATAEVEPEDLKATTCKFTQNPSDLADSSFYIVTVPTPVSESNQPDLEPLRKACNMLGPLLKQGDIVVFESTVYPGVTEEYCGPILAEISGLEQGVEFSLGYSPERINPGDKVNRLETIVKNVSGDTPESLDRIVGVYEPVIDAGLFRCSSIKVAEAAKVIENTQRDVNIALMNELSLICQRINIPTLDVIEAASTKWNFLPFTPGLVGGHCIGIDPYYLASLSERVGHHPEVILSGRRVNDAMPRRTANTLVKLLVKSGVGMRTARVGVFGISFKEDVPDMRNSKALDVVESLRSFGCRPFVHDALCDPEEALKNGIELCDFSEMSDLDLMIVVSPHQQYINDPNFLRFVKKDGIFADIRGAFKYHERSETLIVWSL